MTTARKNGRNTLFLAVLVSVSILVTCDASPMDGYVDTQAVRSYAPVKLRLECERLLNMGPHHIGGYHALNAFIDRLAKDRDEAALRLIVAEELPGLERAANCYVSVVGPREALSFARSLDAKGWRATLWALSSTNSPEVRAYVGHLARSGSPWERAVAFDIDFCQRWGDLVDSAWEDLESTERIYQGLWSDCTLGEAAREYLERFEKNRPIPPRTRQGMGEGISP